MMYLLSGVLAILLAQPTIASSSEEEKVWTLENMPDAATLNCNRLKGNEKKHLAQFIKCEQDGFRRFNRESGYYISRAYYGSDDTFREEYRCLSYKCNRCEEWFCMISNGKPVKCVPECRRYKWNEMCKGCKKEFNTCGGGSFECVLNTKLEMLDFHFLQGWGGNKGGTARHGTDYGGHPFEHGVEGLKYILTSMMNGTHPEYERYPELGVMVKFPGCGGWRFKKKRKIWDNKWFSLNRKNQLKMVRRFLYRSAWGNHEEIKPLRDQVKSYEMRLEKEELERKKKLAEIARKTAERHKKKEEKRPKRLNKEQLSKKKNGNKCNSCGEKFPTFTLFGGEKKKRSSKEQCVTCGKYVHTNWNTGECSRTMKVKGGTFENVCKPCRESDRFIWPKEALTRRHSAKV